MTDSTTISAARATSRLSSVRADAVRAPAARRAARARGAEASDAVGGDVTAADEAADQRLGHVAGADEADRSSGEDRQGSRSLPHSTPRRRLVTRSAASPRCRRAAAPRRSRRRRSRPSACRRSREVCWSWAQVLPSARLIASAPAAPSLPMPVITTASVAAAVHLGGREHRHVGGGAAAVDQRAVGERRPCRGRRTRGGDRRARSGTAPASGRSPCWASRTRPGWPRRGARRARPVKPAGMCCTMTIARRRSAGSAGMSSESAAGPPVEIAMHAQARQPAGQRGARDGDRSPEGRPAWRQRRRRGGATAAAATSLRDQLVGDLAEIDRDLAGGLGHEVDGAGGERVERLLRALAVCAENITTGVGRCCMMRAHGLGAVHAGHVEVHRDDVGRELRDLGERLVAVLRLADDLERAVARASWRSPRA